MKSIVGDHSEKFAVDIVRLYQYLKDTKKEYVLSKQILKAGTSIGANIAEAQGGISKTDFSAKMSIAYKESLETQYWLDLLKNTDYIGSEIHGELSSKLSEISKMLFCNCKNIEIKRLTRSTNH